MTRPIAAPERLSRLLALVPWLSAHDGVTVSEAAAHFGVTTEELVDDLNLLICSGLPGYGPEHLVDIQFWDEDEEIHVLDPQTLTAPMRLTPDEVTALLVGLRVLAQVPGDHDRDALVTATAKLERAGGGALAADLVDMRIASGDHAAEVLDEAIAQGLSVQMTYAGITREDVTERTITPMRVLVGQGYTYVEAWCDLAEAVRTFRLDRIIACSLGGPSTPPLVGAPEDEPAAQTRVELRLQPSASWLVEAHGAKLLGDTDGFRSVELMVSDLEWAARLILSLGGQARAVSPTTLVDRVVTLARESLSGYGASSTA
jgi:proteasome accessory factor C